VLESCTNCGHVFQNPRLNGEGLEFYYRDFYDGLGAEGMDSTLQFNRSGHEGRARMVLASAGTPKQWLDVGTGHGHFPQDAKRLLPDTEFDGLDMTDGVLLAQQEGRIGKSYHGNFVELAEEIAGQYDVISMYHYLEHTLDPGKEIAAARTALPAGGYLAIELPDPESAWSRLLGRWWTAWLQPQHLHMMPIANLRARLTELGFTVVAEQRAEPHIATDTVNAALLIVNAATIAGENLAWRAASPSRFRKALRKTVFVASLPLVVAALIVDRVTAPIGRKRGMSNTYRVLARRTS
jgi:ubiquinone/menaquinone biosynthesis C-methylase UbiE